MPPLARFSRPLALAGVLLGALPAAASASPTVALQPAAGPAATIATVRGAGLPARRAVAIRVASSTTRATTGRSGRFTARVRIPAGARGWSSITTRVGRVRVVDRFHAQRASSAAGEVAAANGAWLRWTPLGTERVRFTGAGLRRNGTVTVWLGTRRLATLRANARGRLKATLNAVPGRGFVRAGALRLPFTLLARPSGGGLATTAPASALPAGTSGGGASGASGAKVPGSSFTLPGHAPAAPATPAPDTADPTFPMRAAFYYPWFPEAWKQGGMSPWTHYTPLLGYYSSDDTAVIAKHLDEMAYGKIQVGISSWWGQGHYTDNRLGKILSVTRSTGSNIRWAAYYENEGFGDPSVAQLTSDLAYLSSHYGSDPRYLRINGRPVVFVYGDANDNCAMADRWHAANVASGANAYVVLKVFPGYQSCASQPEQWHQYAPAGREQSFPGRSFTISPGFWLATESTPRLARDITCFRRAVRDMVASGAPWQLITTFSEWGEGTPVEPAQQWQSASGYGDYLDALHNDGAGAAASAPC